MRGTSLVWRFLNRPISRHVVRLGRGRRWLSVDRVAEGVRKLRYTPAGAVVRQWAQQSDQSEEPTMAGVVAFQTLTEAIRAGYQVADRTEHGYVVRIKSAAGWAMAVVDLRSSAFVGLPGQHMRQ
jgi:hypothetical protein